MPLVLAREDGSGRSDANSYADAADGDAYHEGHLYASAWTAATTANKQAALVMATRLIDGLFRFNGFKRTTTQALQWPRRVCRDPDADGGVMPSLLLIRGPFLDETKVPAVVVQATCELARGLLEADRTEDPVGEGLKTFRLEGAVAVEFLAADRRPVVPTLVQGMLARFGQYLGDGGEVVKLERV
jgi:hypothetical protein